MNLRHLGVFICLLVLAAIARSQVTTGTLNVQVVDASGAAMVGANVTVTHVASGQRRVGTTSQMGLYRAAFMPVGGYSITAGAPGFTTKTLEGVILQVDQNTTIPITLDPSAVAETVEVTAATPLLETNTSSVGQVMENQRIVDLPLNGRNPFALGLLAGNTVPIQGFGSNLPFAGGGGRIYTNEIMIDGAENNTTQNGSNIGRAGTAYIPSVDGVQEFKVQTNNFSAEYGYSAGMVMNVTMKSGTNGLHGTLFEFVRNDAFDANNFFSNKAGRPKAKFRQNQFGGSAGGPIFKDRTFFFFDYEQTIIRTAASSSISDVPPMPFRSGDLSAYPETIYDVNQRTATPSGPVVSVPYPNNRIPSSQLNQTAVDIMAEVPAPNTGPPDAQSRNFFLQNPRGEDAYKWDTKIDHRFGDNNNIFGRLSWANQDTPSPGRFGEDNALGGGSISLRYSRQVVVNDTHVFSPNVVNEARFAYTHYNGSTLATTAEKGREFAERTGLGVFESPKPTFPSQTFPYSGSAQGAQQFSAIGAGGNSTPSFENRFQWADNVNITRGNHTLKIGTDFRYLRLDILRTQAGAFIYGSTFTASADDPGSGAPFADFMLGFPTQKILENIMLDWGRAREYYSGSYFQDDWKVTRKLTLNLGVRYDLFTQPVDAKDLGSMFNPALGRFVRPGTEGYTRAIVDGDHNNIAPRVGFAYQATPKLVIRGGYGAFYGFRDRNTETTQMAMSPPNKAQYAAPIVTPQTVSPPMTINESVPAIEGDYLLESFTPDNPLQSNFRFTTFDKADMPVAHQANITFQYEPAPNWLLSAAFTQNLGRDLTSGWYNRNSLPIEAALNARNTQRDRPFPHITGWTIESGSEGSSHYHAANFKVEKRFSAGLTFLANYTISKHIENLGHGICNFTQTTTTIMMDSYAPEREKILAPLDVPQVLIVSYLYELPWGIGKPWLNSGPLARVLGNWQVNGITTLRGGFPSDVLTNVQPPVYSNYNVPDRVSGVGIYLHEGVDGYLNPAAFTVPGTVPDNNGNPVQMYGNSARTVARSPGSVNTDFSVFKELVFNERIRAQLRFEFFNLTNTPTFFFGSPTSGSLSCRGKSGGPCTNTDFGTLASGTATGRQIQFGAKVIF